MRVTPGPRGRLSAAEIDAAVAQLGDSVTDRPLLLDLSTSAYLHQDTLLFLGGFFRARAETRLRTRLRLAQRVRLFDFLRSWHFFEFLCHVTNTSIDQILTLDTMRFLSRQNDPPRYVRVVDDPLGGYENLLLREQFSITPIDLSVNPVRAATVLQDRWLEQHLVSILDTLLTRDERRVDGQRVATHVVLELVLNAASHPGASMAFLSSQFDVSDPDQRALSLSVWDDGVSMAETLTQALGVGGIKSAAFGAVDEEFLVEITNGPRSERVMRLTSSQQDLPVDSETLNIVAFMLGVSSKPNSPRGRNSGLSPHVVQASLSAAQVDAGGLGLYLVRRTAIDLFGGSVTYKTGHYRYSIRSGGRDGSYAVSARVSHQETCKIAGNLIEVILPLGMAPNAS